MLKQISTSLSRWIRVVTDSVDDPFSRDITGLPEATATAIVELHPGDTFAIRAGMVRKRIGDATVKMLAYNNSIPCATLKVSQGSEVAIDFTNDTDIEATVHWHGLRLDNRFDGVPMGIHGGMQPPVPIGGRFTYRLRFPDAGLFWYHPHIREDYTQEHGLYGNILVVPSDRDYWSPVNREVTLVLDDILMAKGQVAPFSRSESNRTAMGRFGNVMLVNGETSFALAANRGEVIRFYLTNTANVRIFNFRIPGARLKLVGGDNGRVEHEEFVEGVILAPSERAIVDVLFERVGQFPIEHRTPDKTYPLGTVTVSEQPVERSFATAFEALRRNGEMEAERARIEADFDRVPDKTIALIGEMPGMRHGGMHHEMDDIEWEDTMAMHNRMTTLENMHWKIVDRATGKANHDIDWSFDAGDRVKVRIVNEPNSDHPMQHPFHFHGERFLVLGRDGKRNENLVWKDTVLVRTGETVDILVDMSNPGLWMAHCHIAEHVEGGMMFNFVVRGNGADDVISSTHHSHMTHEHSG